MFINLHKLMDLPVITESGDRLGKVYDVEVDIEAHTIRAYHVRNLLRSSAYLIKPSQIKSVTTEEKIIVYDAAVKGGSLALAKGKKSPGAEMAGSIVSAREEG